MRKHIKTALAVSAGIVTAGAMAAGAGAVPLPGLGGDGRTAAENGPVERAEVREDFNDDGYNDLAIGALEGNSGQGSVTVVYGSAEGLDHSSAVTLLPPDQDSEFGRFGRHLLAEDLDGDSVTDLVVVTGGGAGKADRVFVFWGASERGLSGEDNVDVGSADKFAAGDFNGDGSVELLLSPYMSADESQLLHTPFDRDGTPAKEQTVDIGNPGSFADVFTLAAGDVTGDGKDDLVVIQSMEEGARYGLFFTGSQDGLTRTEDQMPQALSATLGDFDGDGHQDLAYREAPGGVVEGPWTDAGTVHVWYGAKTGLGGRKATFTQATPGIPGAHEENDLFGAALATGDANGDGYDDLAVGVPGEAIGDKAKAGSVVLLKGGANGLTGTDAQAFSQDFAGVPGVAEANDVFGAAVRLLDTDHDGKADLAASAPGENDDTGAVWSFPGTAQGVSPADADSFGPGDLNVPNGGGAFGAVFNNSTENILWGVKDD